MDANPQSWSIDSLYLKNKNALLTEISETDLAASQPENEIKLLLKESRIFAWAMWETMEANVLRKMRKCSEISFLFDSLFSNYSKYHPLLVEVDLTKTERDRGSFLSLSLANIAALSSPFLF